MYDLLSFIKNCVLAIVLYSAACFLIFAVLSWLGEVHVPESAGYDTVRINDLETIVSYVEEYKVKQGHYPFQDTFFSMKDKNNLFKDVSTLNVIIASNEQQQMVESNFHTLGHYSIQYRRTEGKLFPGFYIHVTDFIDELEKGLGRDIVMPFDPLPYDSHNFRPGIYEYEVSGQGYSVRVPLSTTYSFYLGTNTLQAHYGVSAGRGHNDVNSFEDLLASDLFRRVKNKNSMKIKSIKKRRDRAYKNEVFKKSNELLYLPPYVVKMPPQEVAVRIGQIPQQMKQIELTNRNDKETDSPWSVVKDCLVMVMLLFTLPASLVVFMLFGFPPV